MIVRRGRAGSGEGARANTAPRAAEGIVDRAMVDAVAALVGLADAEVIVVRVRSPPRGQLRVIAGQHAADVGGLSVRDHGC
jgi:hypothetical protein